MVGHRHWGVDSLSVRRDAPSMEANGEEGPFCADAEVGAGAQTRPLGSAFIAATVSPWDRDGALLPVNSRLALGMGPATVERRDFETAEETARRPKRRCC